MKVDWNVVIKDVNGKAIMADEKEEATLGWTCINYLMLPDQKSDGNQLLERYKIGLKIKNSPFEEFTIEELATVKKCLEASKSPVIYGICCALLEAAKKPQEIN